MGRRFRLLLTRDRVMEIKRNVQTAKRDSPPAGMHSSQFDFRFLVLARGVKRKLHHSAPRYGECNGDATLRRVAFDARVFLAYFPRVFSSHVYLRPRISLSDVLLSFRCHFRSTRAECTIARPLHLGSCLSRTFVNYSAICRVVAARRRRGGGPLHRATLAIAQPSLVAKSIARQARDDRRFCALNINIER